MSAGHRQTRPDGPFLDMIRALPFVRDLQWQTGPKQARTEGRLILIDKTGRRFKFVPQLKRSYLDHASTNALVAADRLGRANGEPPMLLLARYIAPPTAERLMAAGIHFLDRVGNMHLALGSHYSRTVVGRPDLKKTKEQVGMTPAQVQLLLLFATHPESVSRPVRDMEAQAGVSKSKAATVRRQLIEQGLLETREGRYRFPSSPELHDKLLSGYTQVLRPKLLVGRFQSANPNVEQFLERLPTALSGDQNRYSLSGGPAADLLQHYYRGPEVPLFLTDAGPEIRRQLRILPDRNGPIIILRAFGELVFWRTIEAHTVVPPWLIYCELMNSGDPRAHEAAEEFRHEFLSA